jgi:hypothetical protein
VRERSEVLCSALQRERERDRETETDGQRVTPELLLCGGAMATLHLFAIFSALTTTLLLCIPTCSCSCLNTVAASSTGQCLVASGTSDIYSKVTGPTLAPSHLQDLPGFTRSVYERAYALITPESQVFSPLLGWTNTLAAYLITPAMGAHFTMYLASMAGWLGSNLPLLHLPFSCMHTDIIFTFYIESLSVPSLF